jgi:hypothetical protein
MNLIMEKISIFDGKVRRGHAVLAAGPFFVECEGG